jgi:hypothetical protein
MEAARDLRNGLVRINRRNRDYRDGRISPLCCGSTGRMGNRNVLGVLDCRPIPHQACEEAEKGMIQIRTPPSFPIR